MDSLQDERTIGASKFKEQCLSLLEHLPDEGIVITKHGRKLARLVPYTENDGDLIGCLAGKLEICGDIMSTGERWDAQ